jgi:serine/threonine-protein kinase
MEVLQELTECGQKQYVPGTVYAFIYIGLDQKETALNYLEESAASLNWLRIDPVFDPLRNEPRFQKLVATHFPPAVP